MKDILSKLAGKSSAEKKDDHAEAKMQVLEELREMALGMMGDKVKGKLPKEEMHGVEIMAPDKKSLSAGLDLAKEVLPDDEESEEMELAEDEEEMTPEEIDEMIAELEAKKRKVAMKV
jgi:hypothetical protein